MKKFTNKDKAKKNDEYEDEKNKKNSKDENFISFFDSVITCFESCICELNGENEEKTTKILLIFLNFIYNILSNKNKQSVYILYNVVT